MKTKTLGSVKNGQLSVYRRDKLLKALQGYEGCIVEVIIRKKTKGRSIQANRYYWGVALDVVKDGLREEHGKRYSLEEAHEEVKRNLNGFEVLDLENLRVEVVPESTADLPSEEFEALMEDLRRWAYEFLKVTIPLPNELEVLNF